MRVKWPKSLSDLTQAGRSRQLNAGSDTPGFQLAVAWCGRLTQTAPV